MKNILIIDDDRELSAEIAEILGDEGFSVEVAHDGTQGSQLLRDEKFAVLLLDLKLPGKDGYAILSEAKKAHPQMKVVVMTGSIVAQCFCEDRAQYESTILDDHRVSALELADKVMNKPCNIEKLIETIVSLTQ